MARFSLMHLLATGAAVCSIPTLASAQDAKAKSDTIVAMQARAYDGQFRPMQQSQGGLGMSTQQRIYGSVRIAFRESNERSKVDLMINTSLQQSEILNWSANPGRLRVRRPRTWSRAHMWCTRTRAWPRSRRPG